MNDIYAKLVGIIEDSGNYRILKRYAQPERYAVEDESQKAYGLFLDVETTGLDTNEDKIIELAMVLFEYSLSSGVIYRIVEIFDEFEDPGSPLSPEIIELTGITDEMVQGKILDESKVRRFVDSASVIIAHNADFDRKVVENRFPFFQDKPWGCSLKQVPWKEEGIPNAKLEYLAYRYGFFFDGHRASNDCLASIHILAQILPVTKQPVFQALLKTARASTYRIWAVDSEYGKKDLLKDRGYRWNSGDNDKPKSWYKDLNEDELPLELEFLNLAIYSR